MEDDETGADRRDGKSNSSDDAPLLPSEVLLATRTTQGQEDIKLLKAYGANFYRVST